MEKIITTNLGNTLAHLIEAKQLKDNKKFTGSQLAKAINVDRSLIQRILNNKTSNPTINTIIKIVKFFTQDGFNLHIDDLINPNKALVDINAQSIPIEKLVRLPLYEMEYFSEAPIGEISLQLQNSSSSIKALISNKDLDPIFKAGSLFIIDGVKKIKKDNLVALNLNNKIKIAKFVYKNKKKIFVFFSKNESEIQYEKICQYNILGVVIRIIAKT